MQLSYPGKKGFGSETAVILSAYHTPITFAACFFFFFFRSTAQLQYAEDSQPFFISTDTRPISKFLAV